MRKVHQAGIGHRDLEPAAAPTAPAKKTWDPAF